MDCPFQPDRTCRLSTASRRQGCRSQRQAGCCRGAPGARPRNSQQLPRAGAAGLGNAMRFMLTAGVSGAAEAMRIGPAQEVGGARAGSEPRNSQLWSAGDLSRRRDELGLHGRAGDCLCRSGRPSSSSAGSPSPPGFPSPAGRAPSLLVSPRWVRAAPGPPGLGAGRHARVVTGSGRDRSEFLVVRCFRGAYRARTPAFRAG